MKYLRIRTRIHFCSDHVMFLPLSPSCYHPRSQRPRSFLVSVLNNRIAASGDESVLKSLMPKSAIYWKATSHHSSELDKVSSAIQRLQDHFFCHLYQRTVSLEIP